MYMCRTLLKSRNVPSLNLFVNFWLFEHGSILKNSQFPISTEIYMELYLKAIRDTEPKFSGFSYLIDTNTLSKFHQNL